MTKAGFRIWIRICIGFTSLKSLDPDPDLNFLSPSLDSGPDPHFDPTLFKQKKRKILEREKSRPGSESTNISNPESGSANISNPGSRSETLDCRHQGLIEDGVCLCWWRPLSFPQFVHSSRILAPRLPPHKQNHFIATIKQGHL